MNWKSAPDLNLHLRRGVLVPRFYRNPVLWMYLPRGKEIGRSWQRLWPHCPQAVAGNSHPWHELCSETIKISLQTEICLTESTNHPIQPIWSTNKRLRSLKTLVAKQGAGIQSWRTQQDRCQSAKIWQLRSPPNQVLPIGAQIFGDISQLWGLPNLN